ncbi:MAG TPA: hypothetical protein VGG76_06610, partial [Gemmatimonadaceae bacterium]
MSLFVTTLLVKVTLLLAFALVVVALMRGFAPGHRHVVLLASLTAALALPALMLVTPEWRIALLPSAAPAL